MTALTSSSNSTGRTTIVEGRSLTQTRADADIVRWNFGDQDSFLLERALADQSLAELELVGHALAFFVRVAGEQLQHQLVLDRFRQIEDALLCLDERRQFR